MSSISELLEFVGNNEIVCYGAGKYGAQVMWFLKSQGKNVLYYVETTIGEKREAFGIPVKSIYEIEMNDEYRFIVSASNVYHADMKKVLSERGAKHVFCVDEELLDEIQTVGVKGNQKLQNIYEGKRCFILGMGPSIKHQNLTLLKNEIVLSCSWCTLLDEYGKLEPEIYVNPAIMKDYVRSRSELEEYGEEVYAYLDERLKSRTIILDSQDRVFIERKGHFGDKDVFYLHQSGNWGSEDACELTQKTPEIQTATTMMLKIAIYMGFSEIYLLGTEHDIVKRDYEHSYDMKKLDDMGYHALYNTINYHKSQVDTEWSNRILLRTAFNIFDQYYELHKIAEKKGIKIFNATQGGDLDEYERVDYDRLF
jgi:hypothetical protein